MQGDARREALRHRGCTCRQRGSNCVDSMAGTRALVPHIKAHLPPRPKPPTPPRRPPIRVRLPPCQIKRGKTYNARRLSLSNACRVIGQLALQLEYQGVSTQAHDARAGRRQGLAWAPSWPRLLSPSSSSVCSAPAEWHSASMLQDVAGSLVSSCNNILQLSCPYSTPVRIARARSFRSTSSAALSLNVPARVCT